MASTSIDSNNLTGLDENETKMSYIIGEVMHDPKNNMNKTITNIFNQTFLHNEDGYMMGSLLDVSTKSCGIKNKKKITCIYTTTSVWVPFYKHRFL